jgi:hypothetical protein
MLKSINGTAWQIVSKAAESLQKKSRINKLNTMQTSANNPEKMQTPKVQTLQGSLS